MTELKAKEGYFLTDGEIFTDSVFLSDLDSPENWREVSQEEMETLIQTAREETGEGVI